MTHSLWPPKVYNIPTSLMNSESVTHPVFRFFCKLRALAWGKDKLRIDLDILMDSVSLKRSAVYEYARSLELHGALLWHCAADVFECSFTSVSDDKSGNPPVADLLIKDSTSMNRKKSKRLEDHKNKRISKSASSGLADSPVKASTRQITDEYVRLLGYDPGDWAEGESKAAKWIGEHYTVEEFREAYRHFKARKFWSDKRLTLRHLRTQIQEYFKSAIPHSALQTDAEVQAEFDRSNPGKISPGGKQ